MPTPCHLALTCILNTGLSSRHSHPVAMHATGMEKRNSEELRALANSVSKFVNDHHSELQVADSASLLYCRRVLLKVLEALSLAQDRRPSALAAVPWSKLTAVEAARRTIWLRGSPLKASEIIKEVIPLGWKSRPTKTPVATLVADLEQAFQHVCRLDDDRWALTPGAEQLERARAILGADDPYPEVENDVLLREWSVPTRRRRPIRQ